MGQFTLKKQTTPGTPAADYETFFVDIADGNFKKKNSAGVVTSMETVTAHVAAPDPHTQYVLDTDLTSALAGKENTGVAASLITNIIDGAPATLDTLNKLAAAIGDDAAFSSTVATALGLRELLANKDVAGGYAGLDAFGLLSPSAIPGFGGNPDSALRTDGAGNFETLNNITLTAEGYQTKNTTPEFDGETGSFDLYRTNTNFGALQASPDESWNLFNHQVSLNTDFDIGTNGTAFRFLVHNVLHEGDNDTGTIEFIQNNFLLGNGTDPIEINGISYIFGFGEIRDNVTVGGPIQGYGFQPTVRAGAIMDASAYVQGFYDASNFEGDTRGYTSFNASPNIASVASGFNYTGLSVFPNIDDVAASGGVICVSVGGNLGDFGAGSYYQGINVNPNIDSARYAVGINVTMDNVTVFPGVASSLVIQDLTIAADLPGTVGDGVTIEYVDDGTGGAETVSQAGLAFTVHIEDGVSTAQNIADALNAFVGFTTNLNVTISGTSSNVQTAQAATNLAGGQDPGSKQAAYFDGDVQITGALTFGGSLAIGALNAFASLALYDTGGNPSGIHGLITQPTVGDSVTLTSADHIGVNTAMLLTIGDNSNVGTAFIGLSALGLPAVVKMGTGSVVDQVAGATFAVSLDATATGGTVESLDLCRSIALPNGITTIDNLRGYKFDLPFGDPGTSTWGFYEAPGAHNFFAGDLKIGSGSDIADSGFKLHVEGGGFLVEDVATLFTAIGSEIGFFGATPVVQQASSGAATAGGTYTATEQAMIQEMYNALRAYGLLT